MQTFQKWLITQRVRNDSIGHLARDFSHDLRDRSREATEPTLPKALTPDSARAYLLRRGVPSGALRVLDQAANEWTREVIARL